MTKTRSYQDDLLKALTDPIEAKEYLNAALEDKNPEIFLLALKDVVEANTIISKKIKITNIDREILDKTLSEKDNLQLNSISNILSNLGFKLAIEQDVSF